MPLTISPLCDVLGAEVSGIDWSQALDDTTIAALHQAFLDYHLLCLRSDPLSPANFARVARYFGEPQLQLKRSQRHSDVPEVSTLESTYNTPADKPADLRLKRLTGWHTDDSYFAKPAKATMLQALAIPASGGETGFCNLCAAYEDLDDTLKAKVDKMQAVHSYDTDRTPAQAPVRTAEEANETPDVVHPLIRTHDESGKKSIYLNENRTDHIIGMDPDDSNTLLDNLHAHMTQPAYQYHHNWRVGDMLVWDNRCLVHSVNMDFPIGEQRLHQRILLKGSEPV